MSEGLIGLCGLDDLEDPGSRGFEAAELGTPWDLFLVQRDGRINAYRNQCPHTGAPLDWMPHKFLDLDGVFVQCAIHGALFRPEDGYCVRGPCVGQSLQPLEIEIKDGRVFLRGQDWQNT